MIIPITMAMVLLPYETLLVCRICGGTGKDEYFTRKHRNPRLGKAGVKVGDSVTISIPRRPARTDITRRRYVVSRLFYANGPNAIISFGPRSEPRSHELCIALANPPGRKSSYFEITYSDFQLLREGNKHKLIEAGFVKRKRGLRRAS